MTEDDEQEIKTALMMGLQSGLRLPTPEEREEIARQFGLDGKKQKILFRALLQTMRDLEAYQANRDQRPVKVKGLVALAAAVKCFRTALDEISDKVDLGDIMPNALQEELGGMVTLSTLEELLPRNRSKGIIAIANQKYKSADEAETIQTIESLTLGDRKTLGLLCGDEVLRKVIDLTDQAIQQFASEVRANKNGRPRAFERDFVIKCLVEVYPEILDKPLPISTMGPFVDLCHMVLKSCGFTENGIDKAVYRVVAQMNAEVGGDQRNHS